MVKKSIYFAFIVFVFALILSCNQSQEARRPISRASGSFMKKSIERNKKIVLSEKDRIDSIIKSQPKVKYYNSKNGFWYAYKIQNTTDSLSPKRGDVAFFNYEIKDFKGKIIYSESELKSQTYLVDKQNIMSGLREGIKLMRKTEKVVFLFPSHAAYGFRGDNKKIGSNQPIICTVKLHNFVPEETFRREIQMKENDTLTTDVNL
jgi:gliding motility-associated peptidyl-prolyl isomerase